MIAESNFLSADGRTDVHFYTVEACGEPKAILQIVHGMTEYFGRYEGFAEYLSENGILVIGHDHIGHGKSANPEDYGYFGSKDGWKIWIEDVHILRNMIQKKHPGIPYFILGHSMGSLILRAYLIRYREGLAGAILTGTAGKNNLNGLGLILVAAMRKIYGDRHRSQFVHDMAFGSNNKKVKTPKNKYEWLSTDEVISNKYADDPMCTFIFTLAGFTDLFNLLAFVSQDDWAGKIPCDIPVLLASGLMDPVGKYGKGPSEVCENLTKAGNTNVSLFLYEDMRHEILNERGRAAVYGDMLNCILGEVKADG